MLLLIAGATQALNDGSAAFYTSALAASDGTAVKVSLDEYVQTTGARCLDGSPGAYYFRKGVDSGASGELSSKNMRS